MSSSRQMNPNDSSRKDTRIVLLFSTIFCLMGCDDSLVIESDASVDSIDDSDTIYPVVGDSGRDSGHDAHDPVVDGLVGYWSLDEGTGAVASDTSSTGAHCDLNNFEVNTCWVESELGGALSLDGIDDAMVHLNAPSALMPTNHVAVAAWIKTRSTDDYGSEILSLGDGYGLRVLTDGNVRFFIYNGDDWDSASTQGQNVLDDQWHHLVGQYTGEALQVFIDGEVAASQGHRGDISFDLGGDLYIGTHGSFAEESVDYHFEGLIDEVRVYDRALDEQEILDLFCIDGHCDDPVRIEVGVGEACDSFENCSGNLICHHRICSLPRLRVSENGHHFVTEDGQDFLWIGNMPWIPSKLSLDDMRLYLERRAEQGFNAVSIVAHSWQDESYAGELAFEQTGPVVLNESYWSYIDWILDEAAANHLYVAFAPMWGYDADLMFSDPYQHNYDYGNMLGQRYGDRTNIVFVAAGEFQTIKCPTQDYCSNNERISGDEKELLKRIVDGFRDGSADGDPNEDILVTLHGTTTEEWLWVAGEFHNDDWVDFYLEQTWQRVSYIDEIFTYGWALTDPVAPTLQGETGIWERTNNPECANDAWVQRYQAYWSVFYGSCGVTYASYFWDNIPGDYDLPGAWDMHHLKDLILSRPLADYVPDQSLLTEIGSDLDGCYPGCDYTRADRRVAIRAYDDSWAFFYTTQGKNIGVRMSQLAGGTVHAFWYNPRNGMWNDGLGTEESSMQPAQVGIAGGAGAADVDFDPPGSAEIENDWVLVLEVQE